MRAFMRHSSFRFHAAALALLAALFAAAEAGAVTRYSRGGNWGTASSWTTNPNCTSTASGVPQAGDDVVICNGDVITVNTSATVRSIDIRGGGTLRYSGTTDRTITATGAVPSTTASVRNAGTINVASANGTNTHHLVMARDFTNTGTIACTSGAADTCELEFNGSVAQAIGGGGTYDLMGIEVNNAADVTTNVNLTLNGTLTFSDGRLFTGAAVLTMATGTTVSGANSSRYVVGNLARGVPTGSPSLQWAVGTASTYAPVTVAFTTVSASGPLQVSTVDGDHPDLGSSALGAAAGANRYWTLSETGGLAYASLSPTFSFVAADVDGGATATEFIAGKFSSGDWSYPDTGTRTATTNQATGILFADGLGDFALAESAPAAFSEYRFEQPAWNGTAGEVIDGGSGGNNGVAASKSGAVAGTAAATPPLAGDPGSCRYGVFARANRSHVLLPAGYPNLGASSSFTVTAWIRTTNPALAAQRVMIDDASDSSGWGLSVGEGGAGTLRFYSRGTPSALTTDTPNVIAANTWYFVAAVADLALKRKRVYVFNAAGAVLASVTAVWTEANFGAGDAGQASIGAENNAATESAAGDFGFDGNIDYVRVYQHPLGQEQLQQIRQLRHPCNVPDHYSISYPSGTTAVTCDPHQVTITAHDASHAPVAPSAGIGLGLGTSSGTGTWSGTGITVIGVNTGQASYTWPGGASSVTFSLRHTATGNVHVNVLDSYGRGEAVAEDTVVNFATAAFRISNGANAALNVNTQLAGKPSNTGYNAQANLHLQAIRTGSNGACASIYPANAEVDVAVGAVCGNPSTCSKNVNLVTASTTGTSNASFVPNGGFPQTMRFRFSATGVAEAPFRFSYADAGQIALQFRGTIPAPGSTTFTGSSNSFVVRPFGIAISGVAASGSPSPAVAAAYTAGTAFNVTVAAKQWKAGDDANSDGIPDSEAQIAGNANAENFGQESPTAATIALSHTLNAPSGGAAGALSGATVGGFSAGQATGTPAWSEAGFLNLFATAANYLGGGSNASSSAAGATGVGRFKPHRFAIVNRGTLAPGCSTGAAFTYFGQPFTVNNVQIQAQNASGAATTNYRGAYALFDPAALASYGGGVRALDGGGVALTTRLDPAQSGASGSWGATSGILTVALTTAIRRAAPDAPERYTQVRVGILPTDPDGVTLLGAALDLDADGAGGNDRQQLVGAGAAGNLDLRFGRLRLISSSGPSRVSQRAIIRTEYWNGSGFVVNADDSCTTIPRSAIALGFTGGANLQACETAISTPDVAFAGGVGSLTLSAPGNGNSGSVLITPQLGAAAAGGYCPSVGGTFTAISAGAGHAWLMGRWNDGANPDSDAQTTYDDKPAARASFDIYGAKPGSFIFNREVY